MSVEISERVWETWRERSAEHEQWWLELRFVPEGDMEAAARAFQAVMHGLYEDYGALVDASDGRDPAWPGDWNWYRAAEGVLAHVSECDDLRDVLARVADGLTRRGVAGRFDVWERTAGVDVRGPADLVECRGRVRGHRVSGGPRDYRWVPDPVALGAMLEAGERWWRRDGDGMGRSVNPIGMGPLPLAVDEDVLDRLREAAADEYTVDVAAVRGDAFRMFALRPTGSLSLIIGGQRLRGDGWRGAVQELIEMLRENADLLVYGYLKRGWSVSEARLQAKLPEDWPRRAVERPKASAFTGQAFEDRYAPDAFGVQLLGPGYVDRLSVGPSWHVEPVATGSVLLIHADPAAWFQAPFVSYDTWPRPTDPVPPRVLADARNTLAPILYQRGILNLHGLAGDDRL